MYRNYLLKNGFWAKKGNNQSSNCEKVFIRHDINGVIYAKIQQSKKRVEIISNKGIHYFNDFNKLDKYLYRIAESQNTFKNILRKKQISGKLRKLEI